MTVGTVSSAARMPFPSADERLRGVFQVGGRHIALRFLVVASPLFSVRRPRRHERSVPAFHRRDAPVVAEDAHRRRIEKEVTPRRGGKAEPSGREHPEDVAVRKQRDVLPSRRATRAITRSTRAPTCSGALPAGAAVAEQHPSGRLRMDLLRGQPFVLAIVPLHQITIDFSALAEAGQLAGLARALKRARQNQRER